MRRHAHLLSGVLDDAEEVPLLHRLRHNTVSCNVTWHALTPRDSRGAMRRE